MFSHPSRPDRQYLFERRVQVAGLGQDAEDVASDFAVELAELIESGGGLPRKRKGKCISV